MLAITIVIVVSCEQLVFVGELRLPFPGKEGLYQELSDRLSGRVLDGLTQSDSGFYQTNRLTVVADTQKFTESQWSAVLQNYGDSPLKALSGAGHGILSLFFGQYLRTSWVQLLKLRFFFNGKSRGDGQFRSAVFQISFHLGYVLQSLLSFRHVRDEERFESVAKHIVAIHSLVLSLSNTLNDVFYDVVFQRLVMHVYTISYEEKSVDWFLSIITILSQKNVLKIINSVQKISQGDPRCAGLGFELLKGISATISRIVLSRLHSFSTDDLRIFTNLPGSLSVSVLNAQGKEERIHVLSAVINEIYGRLDYSGWFLSAYESKRVAVIDFFEKLMEAVLRSEDEFRSVYWGLVNFLGQLKEEIGCSVVGALETSLMRLKAKLLESVTDVYSEKQLAHLLHSCKKDMLLWFLQTSGSGSLFYSYVKSVIESRYGIRSFD
ncbi:hypothetical protein Ark11_0681 [Candidatus Ichthyocystis hellenicum]|uniref:Uncharacterized protein n=1 Tax=Candidatus Ichthyocystis hellenicum TaxID=1561003 RepID=A0A0S4M5J6_9BURK|nr:hypothetical protein [Candidatus Ichthyocystis hellenicum]CUT17517.1 hypothetical protein Ark11_0681 [Candidatus Ichthyocystis hellenicum]